MVEEFTVDGEAIEVVMKRLNAEEPVKKGIVEGIANSLKPLGYAPTVRWGGEGGHSHGHEGHDHGKAKAEPPPKKAIEGVKHIVPVASGKGGVGKSTASANLAVALAKKGAKVGLLDLDVYGPSIPTMFGLDGQHAATDEGKLIPIERFGVKVISIGLLLDKGAPLIWRGPLVARLVKQLFYDVSWGELDYLIMDLPPGTGDVQLSLIQSLPISGAVVITTPQDVALKDAERAVNMFSQTETKVLGIIENMSYFICPHCKKESNIFGQGGGLKESKRANVPFLGSIPLEGKIVDTGDRGEPIALGDGEIAKIFAGLADNLSKSLAG
ncbi:MAG: Mrp/NBP35 family ATP-binding protein [Nitrospinae bacterium]|nr:Mrp/NBP35 family ATP-binding protein [Nitrospinota bacterium]